MDLNGVIWDWGDTLMRDIPGQKGPMVYWPQVEAMPGASDALGALSWVQVRCVASNATESSGTQIAEALARVGLRTFLTHFVTSSEMGVSKPDPRFFEEVSRRMGIPVGKLLAVGNDLSKDILPARAAGLATVYVSSGDEALPREGGAPEGAAHFVVADLFQLAELARGGIFS